MEITVSKRHGRMPVTVLLPHVDVRRVQLCRVGQENAGELFNGGDQADFLVDLSDVPFMSSAGLGCPAQHRHVPSRRTADRSAIGDVQALLEIHKPLSARAACKFISNCSARRRWSAEHGWIRLASPQFFEVFNDLKKRRICCSLPRPMSNVE